MRISDWSSDVCSSDLLEFAAHRRPLRAPAPHPQPGEARRLRQPLRDEDEQRHHRDDEDFGKADVEHGRAPRIAASALDLVVVRSEEHTSELQSLMRISYAVFGLKNKKNCNQNTY